MQRRRFVASAVACVAGLFGLKAAKGEKVEEPTLKPCYFVQLRLSDGEPIGGSMHPTTKDVADNARCVPALDTVYACSLTSQKHAHELAEAARLRYVIGSGMRVTPFTIFDDEDLRA